MATTTARSSDRVIERVGLATASLAQIGAALEQARERCRTMPGDGGWPGMLRELEARQALADAEVAYARARGEEAAAREAWLTREEQRFEEQDNAFVRRMLPLLGQAAAIEQERVELRRRFETEHGRHPGGEFGNWPELFSADGADLTRLERWRDWAASRRSLAG